ncbi:hypothetical protein AC1031_021347 [Aphanomyces cochlioides]|nr:hypothetical protein AC1031_021347 [Aphanomyces cochlioides]
MVEEPEMPIISTLNSTSKVLDIREPDMPIIATLKSTSEVVDSSCPIDVDLHPATPMDEHQTDIATDIKLFENDLFKAFDEYEKNQQKRFEELYPEYNILLSNACIPNNSPSASKEEDEVRRLKERVATLEMEKEELTKRLECANLRCSNLECHVVSMESKDTQSSKCLDDPAEVEYASAIAIENEIDAKFSTLRAVNQESGDALNEMEVAMEQWLQTENDNGDNARSIELESLKHPHEDTNEIQSKTCRPQTDQAAVHDDLSSDNMMDLSILNDHIVSIGRNATLLIRRQTHTSQYCNFSTIAEKTNGTNERENDLFEDPENTPSAIHSFPTVMEPREFFTSPQPADHTRVMKLSSEAKARQDMEDTATAYTATSQADASGEMEENIVVDDMDEGLICTEVAPSDNSFDATNSIVEDSEPSTITMKLERLHDRSLYCILKEDDPDQDYMDESFDIETQALDFLEESLDIEHGPDGDQVEATSTIDKKLPRELPALDVGSQCNTHCEQPGIIQVYDLTSGKHYMKHVSTIAATFDDGTFVKAEGQCEATHSFIEQSPSDPQLFNNRPMVERINSSLLKKEVPDTQPKTCRMDCRADPNTDYYLLLRRSRVLV